MMVNIPCPCCGVEGVVFETSVMDIPYFKEAVLTTLICQHCHYKHSDVFMVSEGDPFRFEYAINGPEDLCVRVIRSTSGTIEVPELGIKVEPGGKSDAIVTNIEGILDRMDEAVDIATRNCENAGKIKKGERIHKNIKLIKSGKKKATLILEDPFGNSAVLPPQEKECQMVKKKLTKEDVERLSTGITIL
jgi:zinc finger protein